MVVAETGFYPGALLVRFCVGGASQGGHCSTMFNLLDLVHKNSKEKL